MTEVQNVGREHFSKVLTSKLWALGSSFRVQNVGNGRFPPSEFQTSEFKMFEGGTFLKLPSFQVSNFAVRNVGSEHL